MIALGIMPLWAALTLAQAEAPIPDVASFLKVVQSHQHEMDSIRENYTFHRTRKVEQVDSNGTVKSTETFEREVFFVNGRQIGRLVKRNGVELSAHDAKSEDERLRKQIEKVMKEPAQQGGRNGLVAAILSATKTSNPRRIVQNGRSTLAYDFAGDPSAKLVNPNDLQKAAKKMSGSIWFDEVDQQVAKVEIHLAENLNIGGGLLASFHKGSTMMLEQSPVGQGLWMQTANEQYVDIRVVVKSIRERVRIEDHDFKRFDVETLHKVGAPVH